MLTIGMVDPLTKVDKVLQGMNSQGLSFALLAFASSDGPADMVNKTKAALAAIDLGAWSLAQFGTVAEVKAALEKQPVLTTALLPLGQLKTPFHYTLHDATGASLVVEFVNGEQRLHDNPIGVMTNGPEFSWHMTNLNNYTFLSNKDQSKLEINGQQLMQPDSGIATVALPASNTSVGRFVRAVYYSQFAEKAKTPDEAVKHLAHVMNNFDRPRGITIDERFKGAIANMAAPGVEGEWTYTTEYTSWTALTDLRRGQVHVRTHDGLNFVRFDLAELSKQKMARSMPLKDIPGQVTDGSAVLLGS
jgi:choloylglycine hydrolase